MAIKKRPVSPRQKMINLMYVVLMAMLALNVSPEVLDGFAIVGEGLRRSTSSASQENQAVYDAFERQMKANPVKTRNGTTGRRKYAVSATPSACLPRH